MLNSAIINSTLKFASNFIKSQCPVEEIILNWKINKTCNSNVFKLFHQEYLQLNINHLYVFIASFTSIFSVAYCGGKSVWQGGFFWKWGLVCQRAGHFVCGTGGLEDLSQCKFPVTSQTAQTQLISVFHLCMKVTCQT